MPLTSYEQDALEMGLSHSGRDDGQYDRYVVVAENEIDAKSLDRLCQLGLVCLHSCTFSRTVTAYLLSLTGKGAATVKANWSAEKQKRRERGCQEWVDLGARPPEFEG